LLIALVQATLNDARNVFDEMPERVPVAPIDLKFDGDDPRGLVMSRVRYGRVTVPGSMAGRGHAHVHERFHRFDPVRRQVSFLALFIFV
jgi:hypothetical protein